MKKITTIFIFLCAFRIAKGQLYENIGNPSSITLINSYSGWQNNGSSHIFSGSGDIRSTTVSSGYDGSSGNGNVYLTSNGTAYFQIAGINTIGLTNPAINFGLYKSALTSDATELKFEYSLDGINFTQIAIPSQQTGSGTANWRKIQLTGLPNTATLYIKFTNLSTTCQFRIDDIHLNALSVLPISLTNFTAKAINQNIHLNWKTTSEENNDYFEIRRAVDGKNFLSIGAVKGAGNSNIARDYTFIDANPFASTNYYQLVQHDFNGKTSSSQIVAVKSKISKAQLFAFASSTEIIISLSSPYQTEGTFQIFDINGRKLATHTANFEKGLNNINIPIILEKGIYLIHYISKEEILDQKFIK
jgi:hypothetical protein